MTLRTIAIAATALTLAGCGREVIVVQAPTDSTTAVTAPATTQAPIPVEASAEDQFLERVERDTNLVGVMTTAEMLEFGQVTCDFFANGGTSAILAEIIYETGLENNLTDAQMGDFAILAGIAVDEFCPEYWDRVDA